MENSIFDSDYYYYLYTNYLTSLKGKCKCEKYDALNGNGCETLDQIEAYLRQVCSKLADYKFERLQTNRVLVHECINAKTLLDLFESVVIDFKKRYVEQTGYAPGNLDAYLFTINMFKDL